MYVTVANNTVTAINSVDTGSDILLNDDSPIQIGSDIRHFDSNGYRLTADEVESLGLITTDITHEAYWNGLNWAVRADYTNENYYYISGGGKVNFKIGQEPDSTMTSLVPPYQFSVWNGTSWDPDLSTLRVYLKSKANSIYSQRLEDGIEYPINSGNIISCNQMAQTLLTGVLTKLSNGVVVYPVYWRTIGETFILLADALEVKAMTDSIFSYIEAQLVKLWSCIDQMEAAVTETAINTVYNSYVNDTIVVS